MSNLLTANLSNDVLIHRSTLLASANPSNDVLIHRSSLLTSANLLNDVLIHCSSLLTSANLSPYLSDEVLIDVSLSNDVLIDY